MLRMIEIRGFKCFESAPLNLAPLTLLTGVNGGGKSSVIQALVLLSRALRFQEWSKSLLLDSSELNLGDASDVVNRRSPDRTVQFTLSTELENVSWTFEAKERRSLSLELVGAAKNGKTLEIDGPVRFLLPTENADRSEIVACLRRLSWISAERTGPRELLPLRDPASSLSVGHRGEFAAGLLHNRPDDEASSGLLVAGTPPNLINQVRAWMHVFFPNSDFKVTPVPGASFVTLAFKTHPSGEFQRPQNVGFGLSQLFPVVVALLAAKAGSILIIENPEVHLHPKAQQEVGRFIGLVASTGVQIILETHSDHVLNGIRLAVKRSTLNPSDLAVHFFSPDENGGTCLESPTLDADGRLSSWPTGFFDQFDLALGDLM